MTNPEVQAALKACTAGIGELNEWETGFIESLQKRVKSGRSLTPLQEGKLLEILDKLS